MVYVPKKMGKVEAPEEKLFFKVLAFPKETLVSVVISKAGKTYLSKKYLFPLLLKRIIPEMSRLVKQNEYLFMKDGVFKC